MGKKESVMAPEINITNKLSNNHVQVEIKSKNVPTRYFKVPEQKADEFCKNYKQFEKKQRINSAIRIAVPAVILCTIANYFTQGKSKLIQWTAGIGLGMAGIMGATRWNVKKLIKKEDELLNKHNAEEIIKEDKNLDFTKKSK